MIDLCTCSEQADSHRTSQDHNAVSESYPKDLRRFSLTDWQEQPSTADSQLATLAGGTCPNILEKQLRDFSFTGQQWQLRTPTAEDANAEEVVKLSEGIKIHDEDRPAGDDRTADNDRGISADSTQSTSSDASVPQQSVSQLEYGAQLADLLSRYQYWVHICSYIGTGGASCASMLVLHSDIIHWACALSWQVDLTAAHLSGHYEPGTDVLLRMEYATPRQTRATPKLNQDIVRASINNNMSCIL